jgi:molecular chaperone DnaK
MTYGLGVDLGTTFTAAATAADGRAEIVALGDRSGAAPSVVLARRDGTFLTGDAAERRAAVEPDRVAREVKRRLGDPMPLILGGQPFPAARLIAEQLKAVVATVRRARGGPPDVLTLTHPANWGPYKRELFGQIPGLADLGRVRMVTEPEAAAAHYARNERLSPGSLVAVYDLGGGTFDATVLRTARTGFEILGRPEGVEGIGGIDFDEAVYAHVDRSLDGALSALDPADPAATRAAIRLRRECVLAKESLSADTETTIPVLLPDVQTEVRLTRSEFEDMVRPALAATIASLRRALGSASVEPGQLATVLLVGGSSRIPLVSQLVSAELGRPTSVDAHPKHAVVLGAAAPALAPRRPAPPTPAAGIGVPPRDAARRVAVGPGGRPPQGPGGPAGPPPPGPRQPPGPPGPPGPRVGAPAAGMPAPDLVAPASASRRRRPVLLVAAAALVVAVVVGGYFGWESIAHAAEAPVAHSQPAPATSSAPADPTKAPEETSPAPTP